MFTPRVVALSIALSSISVATHAATPSQGIPSSSLQIWSDTPEYPIIEAPPETSEHNAKNKGNQKAAGATWDSWALPIGNGRLGAVFWGGVADELIQFNEDSLWSGGETKVTETRSGAKRTENVNYGSYQPFGDIHLSLPHAEFTDYRRDLDLSNAVGTVSYKSGGVAFRREYFASYPDQVIAVRLTADKPASITCAIRLDDRHCGKIAVEGNTVSSSGTLDEKLYLTSPSVNSPVEFGTPEQVAAAPRSFAGNNMKYEARMRVVADGGTLSPGSEGEIKVSHADSVTILLAAATDYLPDAAKHWRGDPPHATVSRQLDAATAEPYDKLLRRHVADYQSLFDRLQLDLGKTDSKKTELPMHKRLAEFRKDQSDPELVALMAQFGRYLLISSSRPGGLPANLQGLWNPERIMAPWGADYHLNVNLQMNYWLTGPGNVSECDEPLIRWLQAVQPVLERETKSKFAKQGWAAGWGVNLFGNGSVDKKVEGAWICWHLYENYRFTHDKKMLSEVSFPVLRGAVDFWEDALVEKNGLLYAPDVQSPEWGPTEDGVLYAQELIHELFGEYVELADVLGVEKSHRDKIAAMRDKLATPKIGSHGEVLEWQSDQSKLWGKEHRHISHLVGLFPGRQISPLTTPDLAKAAAVSLENRWDGGTGWSEIMRAGSWARLFDGDKALHALESVLKGHIWPNGLDSINYGASTGKGDKFQIDANLGIPASLYEMLLQSQSGVLNLLPALPSKFPKGAVRGIRGRDGFLVDLEWDKNELTRAVIHSTLGEPCEVRYGRLTKSLKIKKGDQVTLDKNLRVIPNQ
jgi:alpha-L-fucosidase 2